MRRLFKGAEIEKLVKALGGVPGERDLSIARSRWRDPTVEQAASIARILLEQSQALLSRGLYDEARAKIGPSLWAFAKLEYFDHRHTPYYNKAEAIALTLAGIPFRPFRLGAPENEPVALRRVPESERFETAKNDERDALKYLKKSEFARALFSISLSKYALENLRKNKPDNKEYAQALTRVRTCHEMVRRRYEEHPDAFARFLAALTVRSLVPKDYPGPLGELESKSAVEPSERGLVESGTPSGREEDINRDKPARKIGQVKRELTEPLLRTRDERLKHFSGRTTWAEAVRADPTLKPLAHIARTYPDRRRGLLRPDLWKIDPSLAQALKNWLNYKRTDGSKPNSIPSGFGLMTAAEWYEQLDREEGPLTGARVFEAYRRGDPQADELSRRFAASDRRKKTSPHRPRKKKSAKKAIRSNP